MEKYGTDEEGPKVTVVTQVTKTTGLLVRNEELAFTSITLNGQLRNNVLSFFRKTYAA